MPFSRGSSLPQGDLRSPTLRADSLTFELPGFHESEVKMKSLSCVWLFATPWTVAYQAPLSMGFSRREYWSGLPFPSPGDLPDPGIEPGSPALRADALTSEPPGKPRFHEAPLKSLKFPFCLNYQDLLLLPQKSEYTLTNVFLKMEGTREKITNHWSEGGDL